MLNREEGSARETKFQKYWIKNPEKVLKRGVLLKSEYSLFPASDLLKREFYEENKFGQLFNRSRPIGRIDVIFRYKSNRYAGEIKYDPFDSGDFWRALKIIGYTIYLNWQIALNPDNTKYKPAILIPAKKIKLEHKIVAGQLGVLLLGIHEKDGVYTLSVELDPSLATS